MSYTPVAIAQKVTIQKSLFSFMESAPIQCILVVILFTSLFLPDSWVMAGLPDSTNDILNGIIVSLMGLFCLEMTIYSYCQSDYFLSFFFYLDIIGTASMILDITWITDSFTSTKINSGSYLRAVRAARLGARYGRLMRFFKFLKYLRYLPCFKQDEDNIEVVANSVRRLVGDITQVLLRFVALLTLVLVIVVPYISVPVEDNSIYVYMETLSNLASNSTYVSTVMDRERTFTSIGEDMYHYFSGDSAVLYFSVHSEYLFGTAAKTFYDVDTTQIPSNNIIMYLTNFDGSCSGGCNLAVSLDYSKAFYWDSFCGVWLIVLVVIIFVGYAIMFQLVIEAKVSKPLERSTKLLRNCATTMLKSLKIMEDEKEPLKEEVEGSEEEEDLESQMLEKLVEKLMRVMQQMVPGAENFLEFDQNVDSATASWLAQSYAAKPDSHDSSTTSRVELTKLPLSSKLANSIVNIDRLNSWEFDVLEYSNDELQEIVLDIFNVFDVMGTFRISQETFVSFTRELAKLYIAENSYHNFKHGCDVFHAVYRLMLSSNVHKACSTLEIFSILVAAIGHDVGHPGLNNVFLIKTRHKFALKHNDKSPLENMHCTVLYGILGKAESNIFSGFTESQWRESRNIIITAILGTDMAHHGEAIKNVKLFNEVSSNQISAFVCNHTDEIPAVLNDSKQRLFLMETLLHCADISNPYKPFNICAKWADLVVVEFCLQGDREKKEGLDVSMGMDRNTLILCNMQMGFIDFVVAPLIIEILNMLPGTYLIGKNMSDNFTLWGRRRIAEITASSLENKDDEIRKIEERVTKFTDRMAFVTNLQELVEQKFNIE